MRLILIHWLKQALHEQHRSKSNTLRISPVATGGFGWLIPPQTKFQGSQIET